MIIVDTTPNNDAEGVALEAVVSVVFDEEVDPDSIISNGSFVVATSAFKLASAGPGFQDWSPINEDLLASKSFSGLVEGSIATEDNLTFTFTPKAPLTPDTTYRVILGLKILTRTIEDVVADDDNTSTGSFTVRGPYTDDIDDTFTIRISSGGTLGSATFRYTRTSDGLPSAAITTDRLVQLESGVFLKFLPGNYVEDDEWTFAVNEGTPLDSSVEFSFTTGGPTHVEVIERMPSVRLSKSEVAGLIRIDDVSSVDSEGLKLLSITPENLASGVPLSTRKVVLTFNKDLDPDSLTDAVIRVIMQSLPMDETAQNSYEIRVTPTIDGEKLILTFSG